MLVRYWEKCIKFFPCDYDSYQVLVLPGDFTLYNLRLCYLQCNGSWLLFVLYSFYLFYDKMFLIKFHFFILVLLLLLFWACIYLIYNSGPSHFHCFLILFFWVFSFDKGVKLLIFIVVTYILSCSFHVTLWLL